MSEPRTGRDASNDNRGRSAESPSGIPRRGWWDILVRVKDAVSDDALGMVAAAIAFYAFLSLFPALAALVSIYGLIADPAQIQEQITSVTGAMPASARDILTSQLQSLAAGGSALTVGLLVSIVLALWSASTAMGALISSLNIVYNEEEKRGFIKPYVLRLALTFGGILFAIVALFLIVAVPASLAALELSAFPELIIRVVRWLLLAAAVVAALSLLYRYAPSRRPPQWQWVSWGAVIGAVLWLLGSALFSLYVENFGSYNQTYGSFAAVVILMLWFNLSAFAALLGAEINAEMEHQTEEDTTVGPRRRMGRRGAYVADHLGSKSL